MTTKEWEARRDRGEAVGDVYAVPVGNETYAVPFRYPNNDMSDPSRIEIGPLPPEVAEKWEVRILPTPFLMPKKLVDNPDEFTHVTTTLPQKLVAVLEASMKLLEDIRERHPGEEFRCPHLRALDGAVRDVL